MQYNHITENLGKKEIKKKNKYCTSDPIFPEHMCLFIKSCNLDIGLPILLNNFAHCHFHLVGESIFLY